MPPGPHNPRMAEHSPHRRFLRHILAAFAEFERDIIAARIADPRAYLKRLGQRVTQTAPNPFPVPIAANHATACHAVPNEARSSGWPAFPTTPRCR